MKIVICLPAQDLVHATFMNCLNELLIYTHNGNTRHVSMCQMNGCYLDLLRNQLIENALNMEPDYILMLDSDMKFPKDTAARLIQADKDIIGCNYTRRRPPYSPIACIGDGNTRLDPNSVSGITQVAIIPTGILLIKPEIFKQIAYPWFECQWRKKSHDGKLENRLLGEDVMFCAKAGDLKIPIWCENDLSREVAHSGQMDFTIPMICGDKNV